MKWRELRTQMIVNDIEGTDRSRKMTTYPVKLEKICKNSVIILSEVV